MTLLKAGSSRATSVGPPPLAPIVQIRLFTAHSVLTGSLQLAFNRLSDDLNFGRPMITLGQAELTRQDHPAIHRSQHSVYIQRDSILLAIDRTTQDYSATHPALYQDKARYQVTTDLGHFVVAGTLHLRHGLTIAEWLKDAPLFVPLTDATIYGWRPEPVQEALTIINRSALTALLH